MKKVKPKRPDTKFDMPIWYHHHGSKMHIHEFNKDLHLLIISGSAASLKINRFVNGEKDSWLVEWEVRQSPVEKVNGCVIFKSNELNAAFGLSEESGEYGDWMIEKFGADSAEQKKYIRWRNFVNIPGPGTGNDGDPNISIDIDDDIRNHIRKLITM